MGWETWGSQESWDAWEGGGGAAPVPTYGVSGVLTNERDAALVGKTITLNTTGTTDALDSVVSGAGGAYAFTGVVAGSYDLLVDDVPYLGGATVNVVASNITQDFQASNTGVPVQGYVLDGGGLSIDGVLVTASGQVIDTQTTDGSGFYEFETGDATFTLTPTKDNYEFAPVSREVVVFGEPVTVTNFVGTELYSIFGAILDSAGVPLDGVTVTLSGDASDSVETAAGAPYEFNGLSNGNYTVTPTLAGSTFSPDHIDVVVADGDESIADMQQVWTISGDIVDGAAAGIEGVLVTLSGDADDTDTTDVNGHYEFTGLVDGSYTVTPTLASYAFTEVSEAVVISGDDIVVDDMVGVYSDPNVFTGVVSFNSSPSVPYQYATGIGEAGWEFRSWSRPPEDYAIESVVNSPAYGGYTPDLGGSMCYQWMAHDAYGNAEDCVSGGPTWDLMQDEGKYLDTVNGCRVAICSRSPGSNGSLPHTRLVLGSSAGGFVTGASAIKRPKDCIWTWYDGGPWAPTMDNMIVYERINDADVSGAYVPSDSTNWGGDAQYWRIQGIQLPPNMTGKIGVYGHVLGVNNGYLGEGPTIVGDWSNKKIDNIQLCSWWRWTYDRTSQIAWIWVGSLTDAWPT